MSTLTINPELMREAFRRHPEVWVKQAFGVELWDRQIEIMRSVFENRRTAVQSGHSIGKTFTLAAASLAYLFTHDNAVVITTAPTYRQVKELLWQEIAKLYNRAAERGRPLGGELLDMRLKLAPGHFAIGFATDKGGGGVKLQGWHSKNLLLVFDEGAGVEPELWEAAEGAMASEGARMIVCGNPTSKATPFFDACSSDLWNVIKVSSWDTPNARSGKEIVPGLATREWCQERRKEWGERSPLYAARVLGEFPDQSSDTLIQLSWCQAAQSRPRLPSGDKVGGVDVARFGDDLSVIIGMDGGHIEVIERLSGADTVTVAGKVVDMYRRYGWRGVAVDDTGVGGGVTDQLKRHPDVIVFAVNFGEKAYSEDKYVNRAAEMFSTLAADLKDGRISGLPKTNIVRELIQRRYDFDLRQRIALEPKAKFKDRVGNSPDEADALMLANYARHVVGGGVHYIAQVYV